MRIDLERALSDIATTAQSAAAPVPVDRLVSRMHRRRAVRGAATGTVAVGAVAAVAVGATQLGRGTTPAEPAVTAVTENPITSEYWATTPIECGTAAPTPTDPSVYGVTLDASFSPETLIATTPPGGPQFLSNLESTVTISNDSGSSFAPYAPLLFQVVMAKDGAVALQSGMPLVSRAERTVDLAPGATQTFSWIGGASSSEPVPLTIGPGVGDELADAPAVVQAQAVLDQILAAAPVGKFPGCGGAVYDHGSQPLALSLDPADGPFTGGQAFSGQTTISLTGDPVIANTSVPYLVITRDGVVVGFHTVDDSPMIPTDLAPGQSLPGTARAPLTLCATADGVELPLPTGTYQAYAAVEAFTYPERPSGDQWVDGTWAYSIVSNPVEITVD